MTTSLLIRAFRQLPAKDIRGLLEFVHCTLFNRRDEVTRLCEYLAAQSGKQTPHVFSAENLFSAAFPAENFKVRRLRHTMSYLLEVLREYLALIEWRNDKGDQQRSLLSALNHRGLDHLFDQAIDKAQVREEKKGLRNAKHHFRQYELQMQKMERLVGRERSIRLNLQHPPDELTTFYVAEMLAHACSGLSHQAVAGTTTELKLLDAILKIVDEGELLKSPAVAVYYNAYKMLQLPEDDEHLKRLKALLLQHEGQFGQEDMYWLYIMLTNGCIRRINLGKRSYMREAFEIYRYAMEHNYLTRNGLITSFVYKNIVRMGIALEEHDWTEQFVEAYKKALHPKERDNIYRFNLAFLYFQKGDFVKAMPLLQSVELEDPLNNIHARRMLVRIYYELGEHEALESLLQSFETYLKRQKNLGYHKELNLGFVKFVSRLFKLLPNEHVVKNTLIKEVKSGKMVADIDWILEKLGQS